MENTSFKILAWNIRGGAGANGKRRVRELVRSFQPSIFTVMETHCQFDRVSSFWRNLDYELIAESKAVGHSGGIWVLTQRGREFDIQLVEVYDQAVSGERGWIRGSGWRRSRLMELFGERMIQGDFRPGEFAEYMVKDLGMAINYVAGEKDDGEIAMLPRAACDACL
ncbi:hypothetical protein Droror1_Dr00007039 [Drosera rotundifolia]